MAEDKSKEKPGEGEPGTTAAADTAGELAKLKVETLDESGDADKYVETFIRSPDFVHFSKNLELAMTLGGNIPARFETWLARDPKEVAAIFEQEASVPKGPGRIDFSQGLKADINSDEFKKSYDVLQKLVAHLREHFKVQSESKTDIHAVTTKPPEGETIGDGLRTLKKNFGKASGQEKLMIAAAIGIGLYLLNKYKDHAIPGTNGKYSWQDLMLFLGACWGVNYLSGKVAKDGKTIVQRFDVAREIDELSDQNPLRGYAEREELHKDNEMQHTYEILLAKAVPAKKLFALYSEASKESGGTREIDPKKLGFFNNEIDGKAAYKLMEKLVKLTSINEAKRIRMEEEDKRAKDEGRKPRFLDLTEDDREYFESQGIAQAQFSRKYVTSELGDTNPTYFDVVTWEYTVTKMQEHFAETGEVDFGVGPGKDVIEGVAKRKPDRAARYAGEKYDDVVEWAKGTGKWEGQWILAGIAGGAKDAWGWTKREVLSPIGTLIERKYKTKLRPHLIEGQAWAEKKYIEDVLPKDFGLEVPTPGKATILGFPGLAFTIEMSSGIVTIDGVKFKIDDGISGNSPNASLLKTHIEGKIKVIIEEKAKSAPALARTTPVWNSTEKRWEIKELVHVTGVLALGIPDSDVKITLKINEPDGRSAKFFLEGREIPDDFAKLNETYRDQQIINKIYVLDPRMKPILEDLPIKIDSVDTSAPAGAPTYGILIKANIAGLNVELVPKVSGGLGGGIQFKNASGAVGGFDVITLAKGNAEASDFRTALCRKVLENKKFSEPFDLLQAQMDNTKEGALSRLANLIKTRRLWIIPTNLDAALNGKILQERWRYTLDFKKYETISLFDESMANLPMDQIPDMYDAHIAKARKELLELSAYITSLSEELKAEQFPDLLSAPKRHVPIINRQAPAGLELLHYDHPDYQKKFKEFQDAITDSRYNYAGFESTDSVLAKEANEIYMTMLMLWSRYTRDAMQNDPAITGTIPAAEVHKMNAVITKVQRKLELAMQKDDGTISQDSLKQVDAPMYSGDDSELDEWMK